MHFATETMSAVCNNRILFVTASIQGVLLKKSEDKDELSTLSLG